MFYQRGGVVAPLLNTSCILNWCSILKCDLHTKQVHASNCNLTTEWHRISENGNLLSRPCFIDMFHNMSNQCHLPLAPKKTVYWFCFPFSSNRVEKQVVKRQLKTLFVEASGRSNCFELHYLFTLIMFQTTKQKETLFISPLLLLKMWPFMVMMLQVMCFRIANVRPEEFLPRNERPKCQKLSQNTCG